MNENGTHQSPVVAEFRDVEKHYLGRPVVSISSFSIREGERILIHGENASGKSTFLRLLSGVSRPNRGSLRCSECGRIGYVPQNGGFSPELSVRANLQLRAELFSINSTQFERSPYLDRLRLRAHMNRKFAQLSGGYQRLAVVAAALATEPDWLILDEPFAGLDQPNKALLLDVLSESCSKTPLLVVALPAPEDLSFVTRALVMRSGQFV